MILKIKKWLSNQFVKSNGYWEKRADKYGKRAVLNLGHSEGDIEKITQYQIEQIFPFLEQIKATNQIHTLLDYGCGPGRFSTHLSSFFDANVIAVDLVRKFLEMAPKSEKVEYLMLDDFYSLRLHFDFIWICLVLGGMTQKQIDQLVKQVYERTSSGSYLCLVENTSKNEDAPHWHFRSLEYYQSVFRDFDLQVVSSYDDLGEEISIMVGARK